MVPTRSGLFPENAANAHASRSRPQLMLVLFQVSSRPCQMCASDALRKAAPCRLRFGGYFIIEANSDLGWKNFDNGLVEAVVGTGNGCGMTMIGALGGPRPLPSCATATVVTDIMSKSVTIVYFILILLERGGSTRRRRRAYAICRQHPRI